MGASGQCGVAVDLERAEEQQATELITLFSQLDTVTVRDSRFRYRELAHVEGALITEVELEIRRRKRRVELLGVAHDIFSMPAWELLLELFLADLLGKPNSVSTVGLDTSIPPSTVQRWLVVLEKLQLVQRRRDPLDKRRQWVSLTRKAHKALRRYFAD